MIDDSMQAMAEILEEHGHLIAELSAEREELSEKLGRLETAVTELLRQAQQQKGYVPSPPPRWWQLDGAAREQAVEVLREWVKTVYKTSYERFADKLDDCWADHPLCLFILDWLSEWHKYLYLRETRAAVHLTAMAEWHTRFLPVAADIMASVTTGCPHQEEKALKDALVQPPTAPHNGHQNGAGNGRANGAGR